MKRARNSGNPIFILVSCHVHLLFHFSCRIWDNTLGCKPLTYVVRYNDKFFSFQLGYFATGVPDLDISRGGSPGVPSLHTEKPFPARLNYALDAAQRHKKSKKTNHKSPRERPAPFLDFSQRHCDDPDCARPTTNLFLILALFVRAPASAFRQVPPLMRWPCSIISIGGHGLPT